MLERGIPMKKLEGRDRINLYKVSAKVNEIIDFLEENDIINTDNKEEEKILHKR